jgi:hypothetical protein
MIHTREFDKPGPYRIRVKGCLGPEWSDWFDGFTFDRSESETILSGLVADQAALHGVLSKLRDLGLPLLLVERVEPGNSVLEEQPIVRPA